MKLGEQALKIEELQGFSTHRGTENASIRHGTTASRSLDEMHRCTVDQRIEALRMPATGLAQLLHGACQQYEHEGPDPE